MALLLASSRMLSLKCRMVLHAFPLLTCFFVKLCFGKVRCKGIALERKFNKKKNIQSSVTYVMISVTSELDFRSVISLDPVKY